MLPSCLNLAAGDLLGPMASRELSVAPVGPLRKARIRVRSPSMINNSRVAIDGRSGQLKDGNIPSEHSIHKIMARTGSFPLTTALRLLQEFAPNKGIVLDPFCGKGTSLLAARQLGHSAYGCDVAPEAVICSSAKLTNVTLNSALCYVDNLPRYRVTPTAIPDPVRVFFHRDTLGQIMALRQVLQRDLESSDPKLRDLSTVVFAALLGILHGHATYSLSVPSAHAYSMAPAYVRRYAESEGLSAPARDVRRCLTRKLSQCLATPLPPHVPGFVARESVMNLSDKFKELVGKADVILTSPPYLAAQTYAKDNWLRMWLLGYEYRRLSPEYVSTGSPNKYANLMRTALEQCALLLRPGGYLICIAGDVRAPRSYVQNGSTFPTGRILANICRDHIQSLRVVDERTELVDGRSRYYHALVNSNGHVHHNLVERIFIARKSDQRVCL